MDFNKLIARIKAMLFTPKTEWPVIAAEPTDTASIYKNYIIWLAAIPAVFGFIKGSLIGYGGMGIHWRTPIGAGIGRMLVMYALTLVLVFVVALIINALAGTFNAQKSQIQALKTAAYAYTAAWVASIGGVVPWLGVLIAIAGGVYSIYLLYLGLPHTMKCPPEKAAGYTAVTIIISIILSWILAIIVGGMFAGSATLKGLNSSTGSSVTIDKDSSLGKLQAMSERMQAAGDKMSKAQKSGDKDAASQALGTMMGAMSGSDKPVEALSPGQLKDFLPEKVNGLARTSVSAERNQTMGMQISEAKAEYADTDDDSNSRRRSMHIKLGDVAGAKALLAMGGMFSSESEKQTADGYERNFRDNGRMIHEKWDNRYKRGEYRIVVADRFTVEASGDADSIDDLKRAVASVNLAGLEKHEIDQAARMQGQSFNQFLERLKAWFRHTF